ncbi:MAG TPA: FAD-dependent oxidoreductase, partial [Candidatus Elarobacter sp.]
MRYDLAVIGSGQGGVPLAVDFAHRGKRVVLFERARLGGCCVNVGCTPSKSFLASAHAAGRARRAAEIGVRCVVTTDDRFVLDRVRRIVGDWHDGLERKLAKSAVELVRAEASFDAPHVIRAGGETYEADVVVIDTGGRAVHPPIDGLAGTPFLTNENFFEQEALPHELLVLGSGYIGLELGQGAARLGSRVTVVTPDDRLVAREESDACDVLTKSFTRDGIAVHLNRKAVKVAHDGARFTLTLDDGATLSGD